MNIAMKKSQALILTILLGLLSVPALANVGKVLYSIGVVTVEKPAISNLRRGDVLEEGDVIVTGPKAYVQLRMADGTKFAIRPESRFTIEAFEAPATGTEPAIGAGGSTIRASFNLERGALRSLSGTLAKRAPDTYQVSTPSAVIRVRGTDWSTGMDVNGGTYVGTSQGATSMSNAAGELPLPAGGFGFAASFTTPPIRITAPPQILQDAGLAGLEEAGEEEEGGEESGGQGEGGPGEGEGEGGQGQGDGGQGQGEGEGGQGDGENEGGPGSGGEGSGGEGSGGEGSGGDGEGGPSGGGEGSPNSGSEGSGGDGSGGQGGQSGQGANGDQSGGQASASAGGSQTPDATGGAGTVAGATTGGGTSFSSGSTNLSTQRTGSFSAISTVSSSLGPVASLGGSTALIGPTTIASAPTGPSNEPVQVITATGTVDGEGVTDGGSGGFDLTGGSQAPIQDEPVADAPDIVERGAALVVGRSARGLATNNTTVAFDVAGEALTGFDEIEGGVTTRYELTTTGTETLATNQNVGFDSISNIRWGRWAEGVATQTVDGTSSDLDLTSESLHWVIVDANETIPTQVVTGTANYILVGNTDPTDNLGNVGVLGTASFAADFTNSTVTSSLQLGINGQNWNASGGTGSITSTLFNGLYGTVSVDGVSAGNSGTFGGAFGGFGANGVPVGAGMTYQLTNGSTTVSGAAVFNTTGTQQ